MTHPANRTARSSRHVHLATARTLAIFLSLGPPYSRYDKRHWRLGHFVPAARLHFSELLNTRSKLFLKACWSAPGFVDGHRWLQVTDLRSHQVEESVNSMELEVVLVSSPVDGAR